ncbi:FimB/Mfa2 family fimbrial subunit [Bacteroides sp.]|uniref:FimB/Mfa2 family fimbrial subunit n=1 Tax=Bacteroides sp. TaxID=29523 RepID=UPI0025C5EDC9|nr:FimB/Mfa2 family fimbrial subunit [Bacteroides sp.]
MFIKKLHRLAYILALALSLHGCMFDDLSHCPTDSGIVLSLSYCLGTEAVQTLPLKHVSFYVFDARKRFVCCVTDENEPFTADHTYYVPLPEGIYTVVSWANLHERVIISPEPFIPGETTLDEACIRLSETTPSIPHESKAAEDDTSRLPTAGGVDQFLYYGAEKSIAVHTGQTTRKVIGLKRNTKVINLSVRYNRADGTPCDNPSHHPDACIRTADGIFKFDNSLSPCCPYLLECTRRDDHITGGFDAAFHKVTLRSDEPVEPEIILTAPGNRAEVIYQASLMEWLRGTGYDSQEKLDNTHEYLVELRFTCTHGSDGTHTSIRIFVNGWEYVPMDDGV